MDSKTFLKSWVKPSQHKLWSSCLRIEFVSAPKKLSKRDPRTKDYTLVNENYGVIGEHDYLLKFSIGKLLKTAAYHHALYLSYCSDRLTVFIWMLMGGKYLPVTGEKYIISTTWSCPLHNPSSPPFPNNLFNDVYDIIEIISYTKNSYLTCQPFFLIAVA